MAIVFISAYLPADDDPRRPAVLIGAVLVAFYALLTLVRSTNTNQVLPSAHLLTIILDNASITACVGITGPAGEILVWLFLFITLGNGFRFGPAYMHICQGASLAGLAIVLIFSEHWQSSTEQWLGAALTLLVVPAYANGLLRKLQYAIRHAEEANKAKSDFLARMSHELRTPLNGMLAAIDLLKNSSLSEEQQHLANIIQQAGRVLLDEIRDVLDISKIEANELSITVLPFRVSETVASVHTVLSQAALSKKLRFEYTTDDGLHQQVLGDPHHLRQILMNLAGNAIKFTESGSVQISAKIVNIISGVISVEFAVEDTGVGIRHEDFNRIFEPFHQADESPTRRFAGTGLGLSIARTLVRLMGGDISVTSKLARGSRFSFTLQLPMPSEEAIAQRTGTDIPHLAPPPTLVLAPLRILVADDNDANREVMRLMLEKLGHQPIIAKDGEEALFKITRESFDFAILDNNMPELSGLDVVRLYRAASAFPIPVIIASADATPPAIAESMRAGAAEHLCKPIVMQTLQKALERNAPPGLVIPSHAAAHDKNQFAGRSTMRLASTQATQTILDEEVLERCLSLSPDPHFARKLVDSYVQDLEALRATIHGAIAANDVARVWDAAHAMKGGSATLGAAALVEISVQLQNIDAEFLTSNHISILSVLNDTVRHTKSALEKYVEQRPLRMAVRSASKRL